jgi:hypothetical protein
VISRQPKKELLHTYADTSNRVPLRPAGSDQNNFQTYGIPATCLESGGGSYELLGDEWAAKLNVCAQYYISFFDPYYSQLNDLKIDFWHFFLYLQFRA